MIVNSRQFDNLVKEGKVRSRPIGRFERADDEWNRGSRLMPAKPEIQREEAAEIGGAKTDGNV